MSIASEISRLQTAKSDLKTSINAKTDAQHQITTETLDDYADFVDSISGGGSATLITKSITENGTYNASSDNADGYSQVTVNVEGGGTVEPEEKDVNFYDYDGTRLYSYTKDDFLTFTQMPANPIQEGLIAQGWNWTLEDAKTYLNNFDILNIGQTYITNDGKTRIYVNLEKYRTSPYLGIGINGSVLIDWGDNTSETITGEDVTTLVNTQHIYSEPKEYIITIEPIGNTNIKIFNSGSCSSLLYNLGTTSLTSNMAYCGNITKINLGNNVIIGQSAFDACSQLEKINIPLNTTIEGTRNFFATYTIKGLVIPKGITSVNDFFLGGGSGIEYCCFPNSITSMSSNVFSNDNKLKTISLPSGLTTIGSSCFLGCYELEKIKIPSGVTKLNGNTFLNCKNLKKIEFGAIRTFGAGDFNGCSKLTYFKLKWSAQIKQNLFANMYSIKYFDFTNLSSVPSMENSNAFTGMTGDTRIVVADNLVSSYKTKTYWKNWANYIIGKSDAPDL